MTQLAADSNLQALSDAFQHQSLSPQNHLGAGGTQRHHETGAALPLWAVWTYQGQETKSDCNIRLEGFFLLELYKFGKWS